MKPLSTYIEYLLMIRHYAFVPGLGGFMFQEMPSRSISGGRLMPPVRLLKFNRFMDHDDGMLANVIMRSEALSYDEANQAIRLSVSDFLAKVQRDGRCALGQLGSIFTDQECHIAFQATQQMDCDPANFGLGQLPLQSWQEVAKSRAEAAPALSDEPNQKEETPAEQPVAQKQETKPAVMVASTPRKPHINHHDGVVELPTRWLRRAAIVLLVVSFVIANMIPWGNSHEGMHFANLVDTGSLLRRFNILEPALVVDKPTTASIDTSAHDSLVAEIQSVPDDGATPTEAKADAETPSNESDAKVATSNKNAEQAVQSVVKQKETAQPAHIKQHSAGTGKAKTYLVIVGSCKSQAEAERLIKRLGRKGVDGLEIYEKNGRYRVFIREIEDKGEAIRYLYDLRETSQFKDAWVLGVRRAELSLSYNKKIKDNDQLPMELSHLNRSAERDQG